MNKNVLIENKNGKRGWYLIRQMAHDKPVVIGAKLLGGKVVEIKAQ